jgi:acetylglutamate kinase
MTTFKSTHPIARKMVIKLGGSTLEGLNDAFFHNFKALQAQGIQLIITHGGGPHINRALKNANIESQIVNGLRVTSKDMIGIVQSTLIGQVNPALVHELTSAGIQAIGLNGFDGQLLQSEFLDEKTYGFVGKVINVNSEIIDALLMENIVPVIACIGATNDGKGLNINGDTVASEIALAVGADCLLLVTDVAGIRIDEEYQTEVTQDQIERWIQEGQIYGGMIPKVQGALSCLQAGIPSVQIVNETLTGTTILVDMKV